MKAAILLVLALCAVAHAQNACPALTKVAGCSECRRGTCLFCAPGFGEQWTGVGAGLRVSRCIPAGACPNQPANYGTCAKCVANTGVPPTCIECKTTVNRVQNIGFPRATYYLSWRNDANFGKCLLPTGPGSYSLVNGNTKCLELNPDGSCTLCKNWGAAGALKELVVPNNAQFTNGVFPMTQCLTAATISSVSRTAMGFDAVRSLPQQCVEVDTDFKCARCATGYAIASNPANTVRTCVKATAAQASQRPSRNANGCKTTVPYQMYCQRCNVAGDECLSCVPGRSMTPRGICSLACKQMYGMTCLTCDTARCTGIDRAYPNGRR